MALSLNNLNFKTISLSYKILKEIYVNSVDDKKKSNQRLASKTCIDYFQKRIIEECDIIDLKLTVSNAIFHPDKIKSATKFMRINSNCKICGNYSSFF